MKQTGGCDRSRAKHDEGEARMHMSALAATDRISGRDFAEGKTARWR
jgi:hypothetical protein